MTTLLGIHIPFSHNPNHAPQLGVPDSLLDTHAKQHMKKMFDTAPDPHLQELFNQAGLAEKEVLKAHKQQLLKKIKELALKAKAAKAAAKALPDTAAKTAETAEKLLHEAETLPVEHTQSPFSHLATAAATAFKAVPGKLFILMALPIFAYWYNHDTKSTNITFNLKVAQKKFVQLKHRLNGVDRCFEFVVTPGEKLLSPARLSQPDRSSSSLQATTNSTGFFRNYLAAPLTGYMLSRTTEQKIYHLVIEDPTANPFLANGPVVESFPISSDETLRITHKSTYDYGLPKQEAPPVDIAPDEVLEAGVAGTRDTTRTIRVDIEDPPSAEELVQYGQLSDRESLTITQKLLIG